MNDPTASTSSAEHSSGYRVLLEVTEPVFGFGPYLGRQVSWVARHDIEYLYRLIALPLMRQSRIYPVVLEELAAMLTPEDLA